MKQMLLRLIGRPLRAGVNWYLSRPRTYTYDAITIDIMPGVFHPGFFFSTKFLLQFLERQNLEGKKFLELGSGSGLISIFASKKGAQVTASEINTKAVKNTLANSKKNDVDIVTLHSDLFDSIPVSTFDWIIINPPYYPADPQKEEEYAWYCGQEYEYFERLFSGLGTYTNSQSNVLIVVSDVCDLERIFSIAKKNKFQFEKIMEKSVWADGKNYLYWIKGMP